MNDRVKELEGLLREAHPHLCARRDEQDLDDAQQYVIAEECQELIDRIDALSQQAEPECGCTMRERTVGDGCSVCNPEYAAEHEAEPAPAQDQREAEPELKGLLRHLYTRPAQTEQQSAQDEREAFEAARDVAGFDFFGGQYWLRPIPDMDDEPAEAVNREWAMWQRAWKAARASRPAQTEQQPVAYLDLGIGGYMDLGTDLTDEQLEGLPWGRHMLGIIRTYGADGYVPADPIAQAAPHAPCWRDMATAPRDGTLVQLLVEFDENATDDTDGPAPTIGANNFKNDGEDRWQFAGWCWSHDRFTEGHGTPVGWLPMAAPIAQPAPQSEFGDAYQGAREGLAIWKRRALEAEQKVRQQEQIIDHLTSEAQGETRMGEPVIPQTAPQPEQSGLVEALKAMLETYGPPASVADKCAYPVDHPITKARAALAAQGGAGDE